MITQDIFDRNLNDLLQKMKIKPVFVVVAVSGGSDSLSLSLLSNNWAKKYGVRIVALTIDHRLRKESADEANWVHDVLDKNGMKHEILTYTGIVPKSNIEAEARKYRYDMLFDYVRKNKADCLFVAHNQDEQKETFFLNLVRGSGLYGLCGMSSVVCYDEVNVIRPMLGFTKEEIKEYLNSLGQIWIEDPSNKDDKYARVRIRKLKSVIDGLGLTSDRIVKTMASLSRVRDAIDFFVDECVKKNFFICDEYFVLNKNGFLLYPDEICLRVLAKIFKDMSGKEYPPRFDSMEKIFDDIRSGKICGRTLAGLKITLDKNENVVFTKEVRCRVVKEKKDFKKTDI